MHTLGFRSCYWFLFLFLVLTSAMGRAQGPASQANAAPGVAFKTLASFDNANGFAPLAGLVQGTDGNLYGTTDLGGGSGNIFKVTPNGNLVNLYTFCAINSCPTGASPRAPLIQSPSGNFYGTTGYGGFGGDGGTVFRVTPGGVLTVLYDFSSGGGGYYPQGGLVLAKNGKFYGTTVYGGTYGGGTVFRITPRGSFTTLYNFCAQTNCADGQGPTAALMQSRDGNLYGTTRNGGASGTDGYGTIFKLSTA